MNTTTKHTTQYKNSPLGLIPEDWELKLFSEVFDYINTPSFCLYQSFSNCFALDLFLVAI